MCLGYVFWLSLRVEGEKQEFFLEEKSLQFQFKSRKYFLQFKHGLHLIQWLLVVWAPTLKLVILDLGIKRKEGHE